MPSKTQSILIGGLVIGLLTTSVLNLINVLCCAGIIIGAMTGVWHYTTTHDLTISAGQGVLIGVLAGVLGAVIAGILNYVLALAGLDVMNEMTMRFVEDAGLPPEQVDAFRQQAQNQGLTDVLLGIGGAAILNAIFGAIGGAIGASVFKRGGDEPGGGPGTTGGGPGGPGGPRTPTGDGPQPGGPPQARTPQTPDVETSRSESPEYRPSREEETATPQTATPQA